MLADGWRAPRGPDDRSGIQAGKGRTTLVALAFPGAAVRGFAGSSCPKSGMERYLLAGCGDFHPVVRAPGRTANPRAANPEPRNPTNRTVMTKFAAPAK